MIKDSWDKHTYVTHDKKHYQSDDERKWLALASPVERGDICKNEECCAYDHDKSVHVLGPGVELLHIAVRACTSGETNLWSQLG